MIRHKNTLDDELPSEEKILLEESFYVSANKKNVFHVKLTERGLTLTKHYSNGRQKSHLIPIEQIIGCCCLKFRPSKAICLCGGGNAAKPSPSAGSAGSQNRPQTPAATRYVANNSSVADAYLYIYSYITKLKRNKSYTERNTIALRFRSFDKYEQNAEEANKWRGAILMLLNQSRDMVFKRNFSTNKGYLIFLNPKSGKGKARDIFHKIVAPVLADADIQFDLYITKSANFARQFVRTKMLNHWSTVIVLGGDGLFFEIINGIFERHDWKDVIRYLNFGIIPAGSGNGLAKTISYLYGIPQQDETPVLSSSISFVNGSVTPMDLVRVETTDSIMYSSLAVGWGFIADIDILSEKIRAIGYPRFTLWSLKNIVTLPKYKGRVSYRPFAQNESPPLFTGLFKLPSTSNINCACEEIGFDSDTDPNETLLLQNYHAQYRERLESWYSTSSRRTAYFSTTDSQYQSVGEDHDGTNVCMFGPPSSLPSLLMPVPDDWIVVDDEFVMVHATYQTHLSLDCHFSPASKLNDGVIWLLIMKGGVSRTELTTFLIGMSNGTHLPKTPNPNIQMIACQAFRFEPSDNKGILTVDGEQIKYGPVQGEIVPGIIKVVVPQQRNIPKKV
ncbi:sphingosine kinase 2-like [Culicoides brevitarsis]|uniref:sphingosine kinase 2-like n=1 Tax=Culicoides brevitarsis TaxID=469753 RepID=UPI00307B917A